MKTFLYIVCILLPASALAAVPMARVIGVVDSHTIAVDVGGRRSSVTLNGVAIAAAEEEAAVEHLHRLVDGAWVYIEDGNVFRSPDGLFVNDEMQRRAWRTAANMRYLGIAEPGPRPAPAKAPAVKRPSPGKAASPSGSPRRAPARRSPVPYLR